MKNRKSPSSINKWFIVSSKKLQIFNRV